VSEQDNVQVLKDIYAAFGRGYIPTILDAISNDAQIHHAGSADTVPRGSRTYTGPAEWEQFFRDLGATLDPEAFDAQTYVAEGERVVALGQYRFRAKATGKCFESPWAMAWSFRDGKPVQARDRPPRSGPAQRLPRGCASRMGALRARLTGGHARAYDEARSTGGGESCPII
jgi:ketosteroid isomerase-like protein